MDNLNSALDAARQQLRAAQQSAYETRMQALNEQHKQVAALEEHLLNEALAEIDKAFGATR